MPCYDPRPLPEDKAEIKKQVDDLTNMLCWLLRKVEESGQNCVCDANVILRNDIKTWWDEHKQLDQKRMEKLKEETLAALTDEQKEVLGLK